MKKREKYSRFFILLIFIPFLLWVLLQFFSPIILPNNIVEDLSGIVGVSDNQKTIENMSFPMNFLYSCGDSLCHQKADRSFFINGNQMAFCSRCTAIFLGLAIGLGFMVFYKIELNEKFLILIIIGIVPIAIDGIGQMFGLWESTNLVRLITGVLIGFVCGIAIALIIDEILTIKNKKSTEIENH
jgi:uncharacterized membrane protein